MADLPPVEAWEISVIRERFKEGDTIAQLMEEYGLTRGEVELVLRWRMDDRPSAKPTSRQSARLERLRE